MLVLRRPTPDLGSGEAELRGQGGGVDGRHEGSLEPHTSTPVTNRASGHLPLRCRRIQPHRRQIEHGSWYTAGKTGLARRLERFSGSGVAGGG
jgi:hypothetical protein